MTIFSSVQNGRGRGQRRGESRRPGQWKLAYADFLTALMAFFLLMWVSTDSSPAERSAIAAYFTGTEISRTALEEEIAGTDLEAILAVEIAASPALSSLNQHIHIHSDPHGLRIDLTDATTESLFASGAATFSEEGRQLTTNLGYILARLPVTLSIEGHTDAFRTAPDAPSNWEISSARASSALKALQQAGIAPDRFTGVTGLAATKPLLPNQPHAPINRRISIVLELSR